MGNCDDAPAHEKRKQKKLLRKAERARMERVGRLMQELDQYVLLHIFSFVTEFTYSADYSVVKDRFLHHIHTHTAAITNARLVATRLLCSTCKTWRRIVLHHAPMQLEIRIINEKYEDSTDANNAWGEDIEEEIAAIEIGKPRSTPYALFSIGAKIVKEELLPALRTSTTTLAPKLITKSAAAAAAAVTTTTTPSFKFSNPYVKRLDLKRSRLLFTSFADLACPALEYVLIMYNNILTDEMISSSSNNNNNNSNPFSHLPQLKELTFGYCDSLVRPVIQSDSLRFLAFFHCKNLVDPEVRCPALRELTVIDLSFDSNHALPFRDPKIRYPQSLDKVHFINCSVGDEWLEKNLPRFSQLTALFLFQCPKLTSPKLVSDSLELIHLSNLENMRSPSPPASTLPSSLLPPPLSMTTTTTTTTTNKVWELHCSRLTQLAISHCNVCDNLLAIIVANLSCLESLHLSDCWELRKPHLRCPSDALRSVVIQNCSNLTQFCIERASSCRNGMDRGEEVGDIVVGNSATDHSSSSSSNSNSSNNNNSKGGLANLVIENCPRLKVYSIRRSSSNSSSSSSNTTN